MRELPTGQLTHAKAFALRDLKKGGWTTFIALFTIFLLLHPPHAQAQSHSIDSPQDIGFKKSSTLTLSDVIALAMRDNRNLISSGYGIDSQTLSKTIARSEFEWKLFPLATAAASTDTRRLGAGVTVEKKFTPGPIVSMSPEIARIDDGNDTDGYGSNVGISLTVPLLRGLGSEINLNAVRQSQYALRSAKRSHHSVKVNTVLAAVAAVYNIVQQRELVNLYASQTRHFKGHVVMAEAQEKIGLATPIDVYRAKIRLKDAQDSLNRAQEALRSAGDTLKIVLAMPLEQAMQVVAPLEWQPIEISVLHAVESAMQHRVELIQADDDLKEAKRSSRLSKNNLLPQVDLVANYRRWQNDTVLWGTTRLTEELWSIDLVSTTDWSRTAEKASYQQSLLTVNQVKLSRSARVDSVKREVRQTYDALQKAQERIRIREDQIQQAQGKLALAKIKFTHGMANNFDLVEAETELQEAQSNSLAAQIESIVGLYRLRAAIGTLIES